MKKLSIMLTLLFSTQSFANGAHLNGAEFTGSVIPLVTERALSLNEVDNITSQCMTAMMKNVWIQIYKRDLAQDEIRDIEYHSTPGGSCELSTYFEPVIKNFFSPTRIDIQDKSTCDKSSFKIKVPQIEQNRNHSSYSQNKFIELEIPLGLPRYHYTPLFQKGSINELGEIDSHFVEVSNLSLAIPEGNNVMEYRLINSNTQQPSILSVNLYDYTLCLQNRVSTN